MSLNSIPIFKAHDIVEDRVKRSTEVVEESRNMKEILIDGPEELCVFEVYKCESLCVKGCPTDKEGNNYGR